MIFYTRKGNKNLNAYGFKNPVGECKEMKGKVEDTIKIEDGKHKGVITDIIYKDEPYNYVDIVIKEESQEIELKCGVPFKITENTALGQILQNFGAELKVDKEIEIDDILKKDTKVEFLTKTEKTERGTFARIIPDTVKPLKE